MPFILGLRYRLAIDELFRKVIVLIDLIKLIMVKLSRRDFYKAMTSYADHQVWQDVYHGMTEDGIAVYIKISGFADGLPPVIQFKAK